MSVIFKIVPEALWREAESAGVFTGAPVDLSDGFIHFSTAAQVEETAARHFGGQRGLLLVAVPAAALGDALEWEPSRGGQLFPHLYGPLRLDCVDWVRPLPLGADGRHVLPSLAPERYAVIDVGTNSIKFYVAERRGDSRWRTIVDRAEVTRLGEGLAHHQTVSDAGVARTTKAIAGMVDEARRLGVLTVVAVGTAGLRMAANRDAIVDAVEARTGVRIEIISGEEEGRLAYLATRAGLDHAAGRLAVFDSGGGSTQFTFGDGATVEDRFSVDVGAASYTDRFGLDKAVAREVVEQARKAIRADLARLDGRPVPDALVGMGGAVTNLAAVMHGLVPYDPAVVRGTVLDATEVERQIELYRSRDASARQTIAGLQPDRAKVILAGACIVRVIMDKLGVRALTVSDRGLRHGVLDDRFGAIRSTDRT